MNGKVQILSLYLSQRPLPHPNIPLLWPTLSRFPPRSGGENEHLPPFPECVHLSVSIPYVHFPLGSYRRPLKHAPFSTLPYNFTGGFPHVHFLIEMGQPLWIMMASKQDSDIRNFFAPPARSSRQTRLLGLVSCPSLFSIYSRSALRGFRSASVCRWLRPQAILSIAAASRLYRMRRSTTP